MTVFAIQKAHSHWQSRADEPALMLYLCVSLFSFFFKKKEKSAANGDSGHVFVFKKYKGTVSSLKIHKACPEAPLWTSLSFFLKKKKQSFGPGA